MLRLTVILALASSLSLIAAAQPPKLRLAEVQDITPEKYRAELTLDPDKTEFSANIRIQVKVNRPKLEVWARKEYVLKPLPAPVSTKK